MQEGQTRQEEGQGRCAQDNGIMRFGQGVRSIVDAISLGQCFGAIRQGIVESERALMHLIGIAISKGNFALNSRVRACLDPRLA